MKDNVMLQSALSDAVNRLQEDLDNRTKIGLGDVIRFSSADVYDDATVVQVHKDGTVDLIRPYIHLADFSMTGRLEGSSSVIHYFGFEEIRAVNPKHLTLVRKGPALK